MRKVKLNRQYIDGKKQWALFPAETTTVELYRNHTAILLGTFKTRWAAEEFCETKGWKITDRGTRLVHEMNHYPNTESHE